MDTALPALVDVTEDPEMVFVINDGKGALAVTFENTNPEAGF